MTTDLPITEILARASAGDRAAIDGLIPRLYSTLHRLARRQRMHEQAHTLDTTALAVGMTGGAALTGPADLEDVALSHAFAAINGLEGAIPIDQVQQHFFAAHERGAGKQ